VALVLAFVLVDVQGVLRNALQRIESLGVWAPILFVLIYIVATVLMVPGSVMTLGGGALFGLVRGSIIVSIASTLAATAAFLMGRFLAREAVARRVEHNAAFRAIDQAVGREGWKIVVLTRLSPVFPFTLLNYAYSLTSVKLSHYVIASWIGMMPGAVMYVYLGSLANVSADHRTRTPGEWALYGIGFVATISVTLFVTRLARTALARRVNRSSSA
jgi:uncharacterized membrane protein YdjX (TVP38/TMEM64 family)